MPEIKQYDNPITGLAPSEVGVEATAAGARRAGLFFNQQAEAVRTVGDQNARMLDSSIRDAGAVAVDYEDHQQISHGAAAMAAFTQKQTEAWDKRIKGYTDEDGVQHPPADPNDPTVASKFMSDMEPEFNKLRESFWTEKSQQWAESHIEQVRNHFNTQTMATMANLAGDAAKVNTMTLRNSLSNSAMMNPSGVDDYLKQYKDGLHGIVGSSPNLKGEASVRTETTLGELGAEQIVKAFAIGAIRKSNDPEGTANKISSDPKYSPYINGAEVKQLVDAARMQIRFNNAEARANRAEEKAAKIEAANKASDKLELDMTRQDPNGAMVPAIPENFKDRLNALVDAGAPPGRIETLIVRAEQVSRQQDETTRANEARITERTKASLFEDQQAGKIMSEADFDKAYLAGSKDPKKYLSWDDLQRLKTNFRADRSVTGEPLAEARKKYLIANEANLDPARAIANLKSGEGSVAINKAEQALREAEVEYRKKDGTGQGLYRYDPKTGVSPADEIIERFKVPLNALPGNLKRMLGSTQPEAPAPVAGAPARPAALNGVADLAWSPSMKMWFDRMTGDRYAPDGTRVK